MRWILNGRGVDRSHLKHHFSSDYGFKASELLALPSSANLLQLLQFYRVELTNNHNIRRGVAPLSILFFSLVLHDCTQK
jgi:hypothetical protein